MSTLQSYSKSSEPPHNTTSKFTPATVTSTTTIAATMKKAKIEMNGSPGQQRKPTAPAALLGSFTGNMPDWTAPTRGRRKSQKVGINCSAMITEDCSHGHASCEQRAHPKAAGNAGTHHANGDAHQPHEKRHISEHEELHVQRVLDVCPVHSVPAENEQANKLREHAGQSVYGHVSALWRGRAHTCRITQGPTVAMTVVWSSHSHCNSPCAK